MSKRIGSILLLLMMVAIQAGCDGYDGSYAFFRQNVENVATIDICAYNWNTNSRTVVVALPEEQNELFLSDLALISCKQYFPGDHSRSYGKYQICITYADGEMELIGPYNIGYITAEGVACLTNYYPASEQDLWDLITKYAGENALAYLK